MAWSYYIVGAPLLLWRRTRFACSFSTFVSPREFALFHIGLFPWLTLAGTLLFFDPAWPREIVRRLGWNVCPKAASD
jgi:hypothetical protein